MVNWKFSFDWNYLLYKLFLWIMMNNRNLLITKNRNWNINGYFDGLFDFFFKFI